MFAGYLYLTIYLQGVLGLSPVETGLVYLPGTFASFVVAGATASIGERFLAAGLLVTGLALAPPASCDDRHARRRLVVAGPSSRASSSPWSASGSSTPSSPASP